MLVLPPGAGNLDGPTLIGYDGSACARAAIATTAHLLPNRPALVVHAWSSPIQRSYTGASLLTVPVKEIQEITQDLDQMFAASAHDVAEEGANLARDEGLAARERAVEAAPATWRALAAEARADGASVIVAGSRGRGALGSTILGSVSAGLIHNADLPVLIVRSPDA